MRKRTMMMLFTLAVLGGCGGDEAPDPIEPDKIEGLFLMLMGAQSKTLSLESSFQECRPKPGLKEFEYKAEVDDSVFKIVLKGYSAEKSSYQIEYEVKVGEPPHEVEVSLANTYKYKFFQSFRTDINKTFNSRCNVELEAEEKTHATQYSGTLYCVMLWADSTSKDYNPKTMNNYVDIVSKFQCEF